MKKLILSIVIVLILSSCGGGSGGTNTNSSPTYYCSKIGQSYVPTHGGTCNGIIEVMP